MHQIERLLLMGSTRRAMAAAVPAVAVLFASSLRVLVTDAKMNIIFSSSSLKCSLHGTHGMSNSSVHQATDSTAHSWSMEQ
jgi:hypothetical protein